MLKSKEPTEKTCRLQLSSTVSCLCCFTAELWLFHINGSDLWHSWYRACSAALCRFVNSSETLNSSVNNNKWYVIFLFAIKLKETEALQDSAVCLHLVVKSCHAFFYFDSRRKCPTGSPFTHKFLFELSIKYLLLFMWCRSQFVWRTWSEVCLLLHYLTLCKARRHLQLWFSVDS